MEKMQNFTKNY